MLNKDKTHPDLFLFQIPLFSFFFSALICFSHWSLYGARICFDLKLQKEKKTERNVTASLLSSQSSVKGKSPQDWKIENLSQLVWKPVNVNLGLKVIQRIKFSCIKMFFTTYDLYSLRRFKQHKQKIMQMNLCILTYFSLINNFCVNFTLVTDFIN